MAKSKRKHIPQKISPVTKRKPVGPDGVVTGDEYPTEEIKWWREAVEGLVIAIMLALLIRGFEAEAFVIPTGSMAPTLRGRHKDVVCDQCRFQYAAGASLEAEAGPNWVIGTTCPLCGFPQNIDYTSSRDASFAGDRILVNKFAYDLMGEPERFDVIVFKNPNNAKQNYIKRLCGLPGETVRLFRGDVYAKKDHEPDFTIQRKPPRKIRAMLQPVHDTNHIPAVLDQSIVPPRWQLAPGSTWTTDDDHRTFALQSSDNESWLRYRHIMPNVEEWRYLVEGRLQTFDGARGQLVADFYGYNTHLHGATINAPHSLRGAEYFDRSVGKNWVGDLAVECNVKVRSEAGELVLELVEGGWHFACRFDVATGTATLSINDGANSFDSAPTVTASTKVKGAGRYRILFSNVDDELRVWVNNRLVDFEAPATYTRPDALTFRPVYNGADDPGDLAPIGVAGRHLDAKVERLRVHRDKYYVAVKKEVGHNQDPTRGDFQGEITREDAEALQRSPEQWATSPWFEHMASAEFVLEDFEDDAKDQFFAMGDNSPQSHDARVWHSTKNYVERQYLIGEAVLIYYPHPWHARVPGTSGENYKSIPIIVYPKFSRMGLIR